MNAKEAWEITKANESSVMQEIKARALRGLAEVTVADLTDTDRKILENLGYIISVSKSSGRYYRRVWTTISWFNK